MYQTCKGCEGKGKGFIRGKIVQCSKCKGQGFIELNYQDKSEYSQT